MTNDMWAPGNLWVDALGYEGTVFPDGQLPAQYARTYMANGLQMFEFNAGAAFDTGETAGGIPLRNSLLPNASPFTCYLSSNGEITNIPDPIACMSYIAKKDTDHPWVQLVIQYDSKDAVFSLRSPLDDDSHVFMSMRVAVNKRSLPMLVNLGIHTPNSVLKLAETDRTSFEIDWFYYSPETSLSAEQILEHVDVFRSKDWPRVNLDRAKLSVSELTPWRIDEVRTPTEEDPHWTVLPIMRFTHAIEVQWNYRTRQEADSFFTPWSGWARGGLEFSLPQAPYEVEMDVRIRDHFASEYEERSNWANVSCIRFNYQTNERSHCTGGAQETNRFSFDQLPQELFLDSPYPNPVSTSATVRFGLHNEDRISIGVFDVLGREVKTLIDRDLSRGYHEIAWDASNLPAGRYFLRIQSGAESRTVPVTVVQ